MMQENRVRGFPARRGEPWTPEEDMRLAKLVAKEAPVGYKAWARVAKTLQRGGGATQARWYALVVATTLTGDQILTVRRAYRETLRKRGQRLLDAAGIVPTSRLG